jgi:hypothetical protein
MAEQIFSAMHSIHEEIPWYKRLLGIRGQSVSLEIIHHKKHIRFLVTCPVQYKNLIEGQIYAHYPNVEIFEEEDYIRTEVPTEVRSPVTPTQSKEIVPTQDKTPATNANAKGSFQKVLQKRPLVVAELHFSDPDPYPIKRYAQFEDRLTRVAADPMAGITSAMTKLNHPSDEAWIQIVIVPLADEWRVKYNEILHIIGKGLYAHIESLQKAYTNMAATRKVWPRVLFFPLYALIWIRRKTVGVHGFSGLIATGEGSSTDEFEEVVSKTHDRETPLQAAADKVGRLMFESNIRIAYLPSDGNTAAAKLKVKEIAGSFKQFNQPQTNELRLGKIESGEDLLPRFKHRMLLNDSMVFNVEELATIYHVPSHVVQTPNIDWVNSRKLEPPGALPTAESVPSEELTFIGKTNYRGLHEVFGIKREDRRRHVYIIGKTGMGKTTLLENMICSDIQSGKGVGVVDPHGDLAEKILDFVPSHRVNDVVIFDPADRDFPVSFNMLESPNPNFNTIICSGLVGIFKKIYAESWGPRLEHILRNVILSLLSYPDTTMLGITRILQDESFRKRVVRKIEDPVVRGFWDGEFDKMSDKFKSEAISPVLNKVGQFLSSPIIRNIVGQPKSSVDLRFMMDKGKIVIVNLSKGRIGEDNSSLLGAMMITKFQLDAMSRSDIPEKDRKDFYLYVDEFQNFATDSFATILSEARKYRLNLTMANQYINQMPEEVRDAVFGNVGTTITFQVGFDDAEYMSQQFGEVVMPNDLVGLNKYTIYTRLLVDGMPSRPFSADTMASPDIPVDPARREKIIRLSRERYSKPRAMVEDKIKRWSLNTQEESAELPAGKSMMPAPKKPASPSEKPTAGPKKPKR